MKRKSGTNEFAFTSAADTLAWIEDAVRRGDAPGLVRLIDAAYAHARARKLGPPPGSLDGMLRAARRWLALPRGAAPARARRAMLAAHGAMLAMLTEDLRARPLSAMAPAPALRAFARAPLFGDVFAALRASFAPPRARTRKGSTTPSARRVPRASARARGA